MEEDKDTESYCMDTGMTESELHRILILAFPKITLDSLIVRTLLWWFDILENKIKL